MNKLVRKIAIFVFLMFGLFLLLNCFVTIGAGERGVLTQFGKPIGIYDEGLNFKIPIVQSVVIMNVRTLKFDANATAASKDLQDVMTHVALNYHLDSSKTLETYRTVGTNEMVENTIITPAVQEAVKASTATYNAEELITERPIVKQQIETNLRGRLSERGIFVETLSITDFRFGEEFSKAIEQKQVAQQNALKAERDLERIKIEAMQAKAQAEGQANATLTRALAEASAIDVQGKALRDNPDVVTLRAIEKWNGIMPTVMSGQGMPFILDITKTQGVQSGS